MLRSRIGDVMNDRFKKICEGAANIGLSLEEMAYVVSILKDCSIDEAREDLREELNRIVDKKGT